MPAPRSVSLFILLPIALVACRRPLDTRTNVTLTPAGDGISVVTAPPPSCKQVGDVFGKFSSRDPEQAALGARIDFRNRAAALGANTAVIQTKDASNDAGRYRIVLSGVALRCATAPADDASVTGAAGQSL